MILGLILGFIPVVAIFAVMPYLTRHDNFFGVSAPESFYKDTKAVKMRKSYLIYTITLGLVFILVSYLIMTNSSAESAAYVMMAAVFGLIFVMFGLYYIMHSKAKKIKDELGWKDITRAEAVSDTSFYSGKIAVSKYWFALYIVIIAVTVILGFAFYDSMPESAAVKVDFDSTITYAEKSIGLILMMPALQLVMALLFAFVYYSVKKARPELSSHSVKESVERNIKYKYAWSVYTVISGAASIMLFTFSQMEILGILSGVTQWAALVLSSGMIAAAIALSVKYGQSGSRIKPDSKEESGVINRDDDKYWKGGMFYFNKNDPSLFVEKRFGIGYTLNFARPLGVAVMAAIVIFVIAVIIINR